MKPLTKKQKETIYFGLSRLLEDTANTQKDFKFLDNLRYKFKTK